MSTIIENIRPMRIGIVLATIAILFGYCLGGAFGGFEDALEGYLKSEGEAVLATVYEGNVEKMEKVVDKSWRYLIRSHLHSNAMGTAALALMLLLGFLPIECKLKGAIGFCLGLGALGYGSFWILAGFMAPGLGGTGAAKEALKFLAVPSAGLSIIGVAATLWFAGRILFCNGSCEKK